MFLASGFVLCRKIIFYHPVDVIYKWYKRQYQKIFTHSWYTVNWTHNYELDNQLLMMWRFSC